MKKTDTESLRRERGDDDRDEMQERIRKVPLAPDSAGVLGAGAADDATGATANPALDPEIEAAKDRAQERRTGDR